MAAGAAASIYPGSVIGAPRPKLEKIPICIFSKHLQWLDYDGMGETAAEIGFDGVALTVRRGGHVQPNRAEDDMPKAVEAVRKAGIDVPMIVSGINNPDNPNTEKVLKTASGLGIKYYRMGYQQYNETDDIPSQLEKFKTTLRGIAALNRKYKIYGGNQNHAGRNYHGASIWDQWLVYKDLDPDWIGFQYDLAHSVTGGGLGSWQIDMRLIADRIGMLAMKAAAEWDNPEWRKSTKWGWTREWFVPTVYDMNWYLAFLKKINFSGPISMHYEYPGLGGAETGKRKLEGLSRKEFIVKVKSKLDFFKGMLQKAEII